MRKLAIGTCALVLFFALPGQSQPTIAPAISLQGTPQLSSFTDLNGQMFAAGPNVVVQLGEDGKVAKTFPTSIARPSIAPHAPNILILGDLGAKTISTLDTKTGAISQLLKLADVRDPSPDQVPNGHLFGIGTFTSVASDGKQIYVGL